MKKFLTGAVTLCSLTIFSAAFSSAFAAAFDSSPAASGRKELKINFVISEPCSLLAFLDALSERRHTTFWIKDWYWKKRDAGAREQDRAVVAEYKMLMEQDSSTYSFADESGRNLDLDQKMLALAAECTDLDAFLARAKGNLQEKDFDSLQHVLRYFAPLYHDIYWLPQLPTLERQLNQFREQAAHTKMPECLAAVKHFMKAPWPDDLPFVIVLVPLPVQGKGTHGESMGRVQVVELLPDSPFRKDADVVFHEACHALWFSKKDLAAADKMFVTADGRKLPLTELYEGMATALGQGCFATEAFAATPKSWYADATINRYAHEVFPLYADYLNSEKEIDAAFCRKAAERYFRLFPGNDLPIKETEAYLILADNISDLPRFKAAVYKAMPRLREMSISAPLDDPATVRSFKSYRDSDGKHMAVLTSSENLYKLVELDVTMDQIEVLSHKPGAMNLKVGGKEILFCIAADPANQEKLFFDCLKKSRWLEVAGK